MVLLNALTNGAKTRPSSWKLYVSTANYEEQYDRRRHRGRVVSRDLASARNHMLALGMVSRTASADWHHLASWSSSTDHAVQSRASGEYIIKRYNSIPVPYFAGPLYWQLITMKFSNFALIGLLALAERAFGRPSTFVDRALRRGRPSIPANAAQDLTVSSTANTDSNSVTSGNWAGVVLVSPPAGENFTEVIGTFTAPTLAPSSYTAACAWIGIDGWVQDTGTQGLFQAGVDFWMEDNKLTYNAWYEWVPDTSYNFTDFDISAGDVLTFRLVATSDREGTIYLENETTGQATSKVLDAPPSPPFTAPVSLVADIVGE